MISTTGEYALRAAVYLAQHHPHAKTTADIAQATVVPSGYLAKILQSMGRKGLVASQRGLGGGFHLARDPAEVDVYQVLDSVEAAPGRITRCPLGLATHTTLCPVHALVDGAMERIEQAFKSATLESLARSAGHMQPLCESPHLGAGRQG